MLRRELNGIEQAHHFVEVAAAAHGVDQHGLHLLVRADDEDGAHGGVSGGGAAFGGCSSVGGQHVIRLGDCKFGIANHGVSDRVALGFLDVGRPLCVVRNRVHAQADDLAVALVELRLQAGHIAQLRGADRGEVFRMGKKDGPAIANPFMELDGSLGGLRGKIGCNVVYAK